MRLRTFTAPDIQRAMVMIRETLGDDAVIISTTRDSSGKSVSVTAAIEHELMGEPANDSAIDHAASAWGSEAEDADAPLAFPVADDEEPYPAGGLGEYLAATARRKQAAVRPATSTVGLAALAATGTGIAKNLDSKLPFSGRDAILQNRDLAYILNELEQVLNFHSLPIALVEKMLRAARHMEMRYARSYEGVQQVLAALLEQLFSFSPLQLDAPQGQRLMLVGPPGVGKTLAVAKIAASRVADGLPIHVATIDNKRAGSVEQLRAFTHIMGLETEVADSRGGLRQLLRDYPGDEPVIIDSFGTNPYSFEELKELTDFANLHGIEPVLVLAAGGDAQEAADIARAFAFLGIRRLLVTRTDSARRLGAPLAAADGSDLALCEMTISPQVAGGLIPLDATILAGTFMQHLKE